MIQHISMCTPVLSSFILFLLMTRIDVTIAQSADNVKSLMTKLFTTDSYNYRVRPATNQTAETHVVLDYFLTGIIEFDEKEESLTTSGYLEITWTDNYLVWNPATYGGVALLFIPQNDIWKPDVALQNSFSSFEGLGSKFMSAKVLNDGFVYWNPFQVLKSTCGVDITYFPFDTQTCTLKFIAWSYTKSEVYVEAGSKGIVLEQYESNSAWDLIDSSHRVEVESEESAVLFTMKLKRKPLFFIMNIIIPVIFLSTLSVCVFILPVSSGERAGFSVTVFLSLAVFLTIVSATLPQNSDTTSYMSIYLMIMVGVSTLIVIVTLIELRLYDRDEDEHPIPSLLVKCKQVCDIIRCKGCANTQKRIRSPTNLVSPESKEDTAVHEKSHKAMNGHIVEEYDSGTHENHVECTWVEVVNALDLVFFILFTLFVAIATTAIYVMASNGP